MAPSECLARMHDARVHMVRDLSTWERRRQWKNQCPMHNIARDGETERDLPLLVCICSRPLVITDGDVLTFQRVQYSTIRIVGVMCPFIPVKDRPFPPRPEHLSPRNIVPPSFRKRCRRTPP